MGDSTQNDSKNPSETLQSKKYLKKKSDVKRRELIIEPPKDYPIQAKIKGNYLKVFFVYTKC